MDSGASGQKRPFLALDKLNLVGEDHAESGKRRDDEKKFVASVSANLGYWTESEFGGDDAELRALHKAVLLTINFDVMASGASKILKDLAPAALAWPAEAPERRAEASKVPAQESKAQAPKTMKEIRKVIKQANQFDQAQAMFMKFRNEDLTRIISDRYSLEHRQKLTDAAKENVVQKVFENVDSAFGQYFGLIYKAMEALADRRGALLNLMPEVSTAMGWDYQNVAELDTFLRRKRSWLMHNAAAESPMRGVWKVGEDHVTDLLDGPLRFDPKRVNVVTTGEFNQLFQQWQSSQRR